VKGSAETMVDVLIAGGGQPGLALALALRQASPTLTVTVVDATDPEAAARAGRASTIVAGGRRMLAQLGVWDAVAAVAQPVTEMIITDSRTNDRVRPVLLQFATGESGEDASAHVVADGAVVAALAAAAGAAGVQLVAPDAIVDLFAGDALIAATARSGARFEARLLVAADGARSALRPLAGIGTVGRSYRQAGIVATVEHERPHGGRAEEHFLPGGPFAILPLPPQGGANRSSLVWTEPTEAAERLVSGDRLVLQVELERRFGHRLGAIKVADTPRAFPLSLQLARSYIAKRFALAGDAAHTIHPIAGQGLNLGYRDAAALAETIVEAHRLGLDIGSQTVLRRYQRWRRYDTMEMALACDGLNRLFANDNPLARMARDAGLGMVERLPGLKAMFMGEAAGDSRGERPRLLRGEAI
jgi:2-octaprenyl-6-methoxyphenol hydroxylase